MPTYRRQIRRIVIGTQSYLEFKVGANIVTTEAPFPPNPPVNTDLLSCRIYSADPSTKISRRFFLRTSGRTVDWSLAIRTPLFANWAPSADLHHLAASTAAAAAGTATGQSVATSNTIHCSLTVSLRLAVLVEPQLYCEPMNLLLC